MRKLTFLLLLITSLSVYAQKAPPWVDYAKRMATYPDDKYLVGLATEINVEKYQATSTFDKLNQMARNQIIEAIHVSIQAEAQMNISVVNTQSDESFKQISQSASKAQLVGLKFDNYYNKKKKTAYAFSYVLIQDIIDYYNDLVRTDTDVIKKDFSGVASNGDKNTALKLLYDAQLKLQDIDQATIILVAMKQTNNIDFNDITGMKKQVEDFHHQIFSSAPVTIGNIANYFTYSLIPQIAEGSNVNVCLGKLSYKDSGAESDFSQSVKTSIFNSLGSESDLVLVTDSTTCSYELNGTYQDSDNELVLNLNLLDQKNGNVIASKERTFKKSVLSLDGMRLLPANFEWIEVIPSIKITSNGDKFSLKTDEYLDKPIAFSIELNSEPQIDLPIKYNFYQDGALAFDATVISEKNGRVQYFLNKEVMPKSGEYELQVLLDVEKLLGLNKNSNFYQDLIRDHPPQIRIIQLKVIAPTVFVTAEEYNLGAKLKVPILAPAIKNALINLDYKFVDDAKDADYILTIEAKTREGQKNKYMHLSYLDATIAMNKQSTGKEIYKNGLSSAKGGGADFELAGVKAYEKAVNSLLEDFIGELKSK